MMSSDKNKKIAVIRKEEIYVSDIISRNKSFCKGN